MCEDAIELCRDQAVASLKTFTDKATRYLASKRGNGPGSDLASQPWATNEQLKAVADEFQRTSQQTVKTWMSDLRLYLQDEATVQVLFPPLQVSTMLSPRSFTQLIFLRHKYWRSISRFMIWCDQSMTRQPHLPL